MALHKCSSGPSTFPAWSWARSFSFVPAGGDIFHPGPVGVTNQYVCSMFQKYASCLEGASAMIIGALQDFDMLSVFGVTHWWVEACSMICFRCSQSMDWILMLTGTAATSVARSSKTKPAAATLKTRRVLPDVSAPPDIFRLDLQDRTYWSIISKSVFWVSPELACQAAIHIFYSFYWSVEGKLGILIGQLSVYGICPEVAAFVNINMTYPPIHSKVWLVLARSAPIACRTYSSLHHLSLALKWSFIVACIQL